MLRCLSLLIAAMSFGWMGSASAQPCADAQNPAKDDLSSPYSAILSQINTIGAKLDEQTLQLRSHENLTHPGTFAHTLLDPQNNPNLMRDLGAACGKFIQDIYKKGDTLWSLSLYNASKNISDVPFASGQHAPVFYHYSKSPEYVKLLHPEISDRDKAQRKSVKDGSYDKVFEYYRTRLADQWKFWRRVHYLAEDPSSSRYLGGYQTKLYLNPKARTITWDDKTWLTALQEVNKRHPGLDQACGIDLPISVPDTYETVHFNQILFMIAEDSAIDVVDFNARKWFQLIGPNSIIKTEVPNLQ